MTCCVPLPDSVTSVSCYGAARARVSCPGRREDWVCTGRRQLRGRGRPSAAVAGEAAAAAQLRLRPLAPTGRPREPGLSDASATGPESGPLSAGQSRQTDRREERERESAIRACSQL